MNSIQENKRSAYSSILSTMTDTNNKVIYASNGPLNANVTLFIDKLNILDTNIVIQTKILTGFAVNKFNMRFVVTTNALTHAGRIKSYAATTNMADLYDLVNYTETELSKCRDTNFITRCTVIANAMETHKVALATYGIDQTAIDAFAKSVTDYEAYYQMPRAMKAASKAATTNIKASFKEIDLLLKRNIDNDMMAYKISNPEFFNQYKNARKIINLAGVRTTLKGHLIEANTTRKLRGIVVIKETGETIISNTSGNFKKTVVEGIYTVIAKVPGCIDNVIPGVAFVKGKVLNLDIILQKAA